MRLGLKAEGLVERVLLPTSLLPTPLVEGYFAMGMARTLLVAVKLNIFEALADSPKAYEQVAALTDLNPRGVETLLNALCGYRYLNRSQGAYSLRPVVRRWLLRASSRSIRDAILFFEDLWDCMTRLEESLRTGQPENLHHGNRSSEFWERYMKGLACFARFIGPSIAKMVKLPKSSRRLLDVGGGHGLYSVAFCQRYSDLRANILDLPDAVPHGQRIVAEAGLAERVTYRPGDFRHAQWEREFDAVLLFNVLHNATPNESEMAIRRAYDSLKPGGIIAILDSEHQGRGQQVSQVGGFNELFFYLVTGCRAYPETTLKNWLAAAQFRNIRVRHPLVMPLTVLLTAER